jgi:hypothetical protein
MHLKAVVSASKQRKLQLLQDCRAELVSGAVMYLVYTSGKAQYIIHLAGNIYIINAHLYKPGLFLIGALLLLSSVTLLLHTCVALHAYKTTAKAVGINWC